MAFINSIDTDDLTNPSSSRKYDLGTQYKDASSTDAIKPEYIYVKSHGALTQYQPYQKSVSNTAGSEVITKAPLTAGSGATIVVPQVAVTSGYYAWAQTKGICTVKTTGFAAGDFGEVLTTGSGVILDGGSSGSTVESATTIGIATSATSGGTSSFVLKGDVVQVAAS